MQALDRIRRAHVAIMRHPEFCLFSGVLACGKVDIVEDIPTACTDGWDVKYNGKWVETLTEKQIRFVVLHEAMHKAYKHLYMWQRLFKENARHANVAADYFVNTSLLLNPEGASFLEFIPNGIPAEPKYVGWSVQQIYDDLKQQAKNQKGKKGQGQGQQGEGQGQPGDDDGEGEGGHDQHDWEGAKETTAQEAEKQAKEIERALRHGEVVRKNLRRGMGAGTANGEFGDLLTPEIDWRRALRDFVQETCQGRDDATWRKVNRRFLADDVYMPGMVSERLEELVIGMDTSGSCFGTNTMTRFVTELTSVVESVKPSKVHVIYWDSAIAGHQVFEDGQFAVAELNPGGGGGTDGSVLFKYLKEKNIKPTAIVQFTDGYVGEWGDTTTPTLWAITTKSINAPFGTSLHITD